MSFQFYIIYFLLKNLRLNFKISFLISKSIKNFRLKLDIFFNLYYGRVSKSQKIKKLIKANYLVFWDALY
jgi:hypothetical protein